MVPVRLMQDFKLFKCKVQNTRARLKGDFMNRSSVTGPLTDQEVSIENTTFCASNCTMCPRDEFSGKWRHMDVDMFRKAVDQSTALGANSFSIGGFGDALMDPRYFDKVRYLKEIAPGAKIWLSTTGHMLTEKRNPDICRWVDTLRISNCGFSKESYEAIHRGANKYERDFANLNRFTSLGRDERPYMIMTFVILPQNEHEVDAWRTYWEARVDEVMIWRPHLWAGQLAAAVGEDGTVVPQQPKSCGRPFKGNPYIRENGDVSVCCNDFNHKLVIGNLNETSLPEILSGERMKAIQDIHARNAFKGCGLICENCDYTYDRSAALVYATNPARKVGVRTTHPDLMIDLVGTTTV
ncbi:MAG: SPASM domain-containing protein [Magnetospirillum sp.]|nr:SPASM domain-containing protein [Magnetospirillum sp.]